MISTVFGMGDTDGRFARSGRIVGPAARRLAGHAWRVLLALVLSGLSGCDGIRSTPVDSASTPAATTSPKGTAPATDAGKTPAAPGAAEVPPASTPAEAPASDDPRQTLVTVLNGLQLGTWNESWQALPARYRSDLQDLLRRFGTQADPELWTRLHTVVQTTVRVLTVQRERFLASPSLQLRQTQAAGEEVVQAWDHLVVAADQVARSELLDLNRLRAIELDRFFATTGDAIGHSWSQWQSAGQPSTSPWVLEDLTIVRRTDTQATLRWQRPLATGWPTPAIAPVAGSPSENSRAESLPEFEVVLVDGVWVPRWLADDWPRFIQATEQYLGTSLPPDAPERARSQVRWKAWFDEAQTGLLRAEAANTDPDFRQAWFDVLVTCGQLPRLLASETVATEPVSVQLAGHWNSQHEDTAIQQLRQAADVAGQTEYTAYYEGDLLVVQLRGVDDVEAFARRLTFIQDLSVDRPTRTIRGIYASADETR